VRRPIATTGDFETTVYWQDGYWQTTVPYWVELLGAVEDKSAEVIAGPELQFALGRGKLGTDARDGI